MTRSIIVAVLILGFGLAFLLVAPPSGAVLGLDPDDFANLIYSGALIAVIGGAVLGRHRIPATLRGLGLWTIVVLFLVASYQYRYELQDIASRVTAGLVPGSPLTITDSAGRVTVVLQKGGDGHFVARMLIDNTTLDLLVDTGATTTVLTQADARRSGIDVDAIRYTIPVSTANGMARAGSVRLGEMSVGGIVRRDVPALVASTGGLEQSLLGMSFMSTLSGYDVRGNRMTLID